jgi:hypothetical protein
MKWAWIENDKIRDICQGGDPNDHYHPEVAVFYNVEVPDFAQSGMIKVNGEWTFIIKEIQVIESTAQVVKGQGGAPDVIG